ncbi:MAG: recombinase family protein [Planctomycetota bacterium]
MSETTTATPPLRCWGLVRASDIKQTESCNTQRELIEAACKAMGLPEPTILEEPPGTSGYKTKFSKRPMGLFCLRNLRKGDALVVLRLDRIGRSMSDCYQTIETLFNRGVRIVILKGWSGSIIDLRDPTSRLLLAILSWVAEEEARKMAERTKEGLDFRLKNGLSAGARSFTYIQAFNTEGKEIPNHEFKKLAGHHKKNIPDTQLLNQLCELLMFQKATRAVGKVLISYCRDRKFVDRAGVEWWNGPCYAKANGFVMNRIHRNLKKARRYAVLGKLPGDYNLRVLAITGDTPADVAPMWTRPDLRKKAIAKPNEVDMEEWDADQLREWIRQAQAGE